ncbi:MAG: peptidase M61 [Flavisolibacter sp.]
MDTHFAIAERAIQWQIENGGSLSHLSYKVEVIFDTKKKHNIYPMAATNIEANENYVINSPGFFGYFENLKEIPVQVEFEKPEYFYASTPLQSTTSTPSTDKFELSSIHDLYDKPIMYSVADTATIKVGNCDVLFSLYSPNKMIHAYEIADVMKPVLNAAKSYLGGKLPVNKYAFIYYFHKSGNNKSFIPGIGGALEHTTSSFYYLPEGKGEKLKNLLADVSTHEFFHIITPLTIASREVKLFNYDEPHLSEHLWLYEGTTEYTAQYLQERYGLISQQEFLNRMSGKIRNSKTQYNDSLPFTLLSRESAGKYNNEYGNVYQKGALIACCLDIYLLHLSKGAYSLRNLTHDLGKKYGVNKAFLDNNLFDEITSMTYPEVREFFSKYVEGSNPLPYDYFFGLAGINYIPKEETEGFSFGKISFDANENGTLKVKGSSHFDEFGKSMGYKTGDEIYSFNGIEVNASNVFNLIDTIKSTMRVGEDFVAKVGRKNKDGVIDTLILKSPIFKVKTTTLYKLEPMKNLTEEQLNVQKAWLTDETDKKYVAGLN